MENGVMIQYFEWNLENDGNHWKRLKEDAKRLSERGIAGVWIPPAYKGTSQFDVGYGAYDLWDLGEFDQKGTVRTKYGTKEELKEAIEELHRYGISVYLDVVINHKGGADETERFMAVEVNPDNRTEQISEPYEIEGWTKFTYPGRNNRYSDFKWNFNHFSGVDYNNENQKTAIYKILGENKDWDGGVDAEKGNFDYLMNADLNFSHPDVRNEIIQWGKWTARELNVDGFRMDAVKHIQDDFVKEFLTEMRNEFGEEFYSVGEYWRDDTERLKNYLDEVGYKTDLFDVELHFNFFEASRKGRDYDLSKIFDNTMVVQKPLEAVTFVDNHDSQKGSALESQVESWFVPFAYALILLSKDGYPCIFYGDYYGVGGGESPHRWIIDKLLEVRKNNAYGEQHNYFDYHNYIAIYRTGREDDINSGCVAVFSNAGDGDKIVKVGEHRAGQVWEEVTGSGFEDIVIPENGIASFKVRGGKIAVWIPKK